jgi:hypothetical protein
VDPDDHEIADPSVLLYRYVIEFLSKLTGKDESAGSVPDPYVFGPPGSSFGSEIYLYGPGSGSFYQQAKKRRNLDFYCFFLHKSMKTYFLLAFWWSLMKRAGYGAGSVSQMYGSKDPDPHPDTYVYKMSRIRNTVFFRNYLFKLLRLHLGMYGTPFLFCKSLNLRKTREKIFSTRFEKKLWICTKNLKNTRVADPDPHGSALIRINLSFWIRIQEGKNDPQK